MPSGGFPTGRHCDFAHAQRPSNLVGTWTGTLQNYQVKLILNTDGSAEQGGMPGTWRAQGNKIYLSAGEETIVYEYHLQGSRLVLSGESLGSAVTLTRSGVGAPSGGQRQPAGPAHEEAGSEAQTASAQESVGSRQAPRMGPATTTRTSGVKRGLSQADLLKLLDGGVASDRIADLVEERGISFVMTPTIATQLQARGASPHLIEKLKQAGGEGPSTRSQGGCYAMTDPNGNTVFPPGCNEQGTAGDRPTSKSQIPQATGVYVNGVELTPQQVQQLRVAYGAAAQPGRFWYDRINGSWGREGGPAEGFIHAGLKLGGPLRPDASHGDTGVFINGRQLHRVDVQRLSLLGPVYPGRCWMDAQGNIGLEGQPAFANVFAAARALSGGGGRREGILSTYDKTGVAVFGP